MKESVRRRKKGGNLVEPRSLKIMDHVTDRFLARLESTAGQKDDISSLSSLPFYKISIASFSCVVSFNSAFNSLVQNSKHFNCTLFYWRIIKVEEKWSFRRWTRTVHWALTFVDFAFSIQLFSFWKKVLFATYEVVDTQRKSAYSSVFSDLIPGSCPGHTKDIKIIIFIYFLFKAEVRQVKKYFCKITSD